MNLHEMRKAIDERVAVRDADLRSLSVKEAQLKEARDTMERVDEAAAILREVALMTQGQLEYQVSEIATLALSAVFDDPYEVQIEFVQRRGKTEADIWFVRDGERIKPDYASGVGAVDVAAFALRVAMWTLRAVRTRATLVLDEPFKHLSADLQPAAAMMLKEVSQRLGIQMIVISQGDVSDVVEAADKVFAVVKRRKVSRVEVIKEEA